MSIADQQQRLQALDPQQSFIVTAPAGSGKTELLAQRFLVLLNQVNHPEEVIAITFTRKAASEMRTRIINALKSALQAAPTAEHAQLTWQKAQAVLARDEKLKWQLLLNPNRLRIVTIDSLCASIVKQMPILANFGSMPCISDNPIELYRNAAHNILMQLENQTAYSGAIEVLLSHLDNNYNVAIDLLVSMLAKREQWLPHLINVDKSKLEAGFQYLISQHLQASLNAFLPADFNQLIILAKTAADLVTDDSPLALLRELQHTTLTANFKSLALWQALAHLVLTKDNQWRKTVTKNEGFPASKDLQIHKQSMLELLQALREHPNLLHLLTTVKTLPPPYYSDQQWQIINALITLLPIVSAALFVEFQQHSRVDFIEISTKAIHALGQPHDPSDLALALDYRMKHILVDEFQDTSYNQFRLLEHLTAGWQQGDARTLFLVGDPMQSIYRFRQAEVGLFLRAKQHGINHIKLKPLALSVNFRSQRHIVDWVNTQFKAIFPAQDNIINGAVKHSTALAASLENHPDQIQLKAFFNTTDNLIAEQIIAVIQELKQQYPYDKTAILVRARSHISLLLPLLKQHGISYRAVEIEDLSSRQIIEDLTALTKALLHPAHRIAWLAILRAPWLGLSLADIHTIASIDPYLTIWDKLCRFNEIVNLSKDGKNRLKNFTAIVGHFLQNRRQYLLTDSIRAVWLSLGGPACCQSKTDLADAKRFFELLAELEQAGDISDFEQLDLKIASLFASPNVLADDTLQIMTIHKAKGLEFDHVILPALDRKAPNASAQLLLWQESPRGNEEIDDLLLAPIKSSEDEIDPFYRFLDNQEKLKLYYETARLLYVAVTRAKKSLFLFAHFKATDKGISKPTQTSLMHLLWDNLQNEVTQQYQQHQQFPLLQINELEFRGNLRRLSANWQLPIVKNHDSLWQDQFITLEKVENNVLNDSASSRLIGIFIHRLLYQIAEGKINLLDHAHLTTHWHVSLLNLGLPENEIDKAILHIQHCLQQGLKNKVLQWILSKEHLTAKNEYPLSFVQNGRVQHYIVDRTFVDCNNIRWIIDYKTAVPKPNQHLDNFLKQQAQFYQPQLLQYAKVLKQIDGRSVKMGLYFAMIGEWVEL